MKAKQKCILKKNSIKILLNEKIVIDNKQANNNKLLEICFLDLRR